MASMTKALAEIEDTNQILKAVRRFRAEKRLEIVGKDCRRLSTSPFSYLWCDFYTDDIDYLSETLQLSESFCEGQSERYVMSKLRDRELEDAVFYYLMKGEEPTREVMNILNLIKRGEFRFNWYESCTRRLCPEHLSPRLHSQIWRYGVTFEGLVLAHSQLLFNKFSGEFFNSVKPTIPYENLHYVLYNSRNEDGCTYLHVFRSGCFDWQLAMYSNHSDDLFELLSVCDNYGQTPLHVNTENITKMLSQLYIPKHRSTVLGLLKIQNADNRTALEVAPMYDRPILQHFMQQVETNTYILEKTKILIFYSTNKRPGAADEALALFQALRFNSSTELNRNLKKDDIINSIKQSANEDDLSALIVVIMSHGSIGTIDDCDGKPISFTAIEEAMSNETKLNERPKILIMQCCQNDDIIDAMNVEQKLPHQDPDPSSQNRTPFIPKHPHFCSVMSSVSGQNSQRGVFITILAEQIRARGRNDTLIDLVQNVCQRMEEDGHSQTPIVQSTLKARLRLADMCTDAGIPLSHCSFLM